MQHHDGARLWTRAGAGGEGTRPRPVGEVESPEVVEGGGGGGAPAEDVHGEGGVIVAGGVAEIKKRGLIVARITF